MNIDNPTIRVSVGSEPRGFTPHDATLESCGERGPAFTPPIDIHEGPDGLTLEADLPGATERNLRIQLEDNILSLYARIDAPAPEKRGWCTRNIALAITSDRSS